MKKWKVIVNKSAFDNQLETLNFFDFSNYGPNPEEFQKRLYQARWQVDGKRLIRSKSLPDLDEPCGKYFNYRDLIECGETQKKTGIANLPKEVDSYTALYELAINILDPGIDYFGMIKLTYGFCSVELRKGNTWKNCTETRSARCTRKENQWKIDMRTTRCSL